MTRTEILNLKNKILDANKQYRLGHPFLSDQEYDNMCEKLETEISKDEWILFRSRLFENDGKIKHDFVMGSLAKFKYEEPENVCTWINNHVENALNISAKVDGISAKLSYVNGKLVSATTRGNGYFGEDITDKIFFIKNIPHEISEKQNLQIRGELVIFDEDFEKYSSKYANSRNLTCGFIGKKEINPEELKNISFVAYTIFGDKYTKAEQFKILEDNGFLTAWHKSFTIAELQIKTAKGFQNFNDELRGYVKQILPYGTDGLVLSDDDYRNEDVLIPENQIAFKINECLGETQIIGIEWKGPSKDGKFVPVAQLDPVEISGSIVSQCSLYNIDFVTKNDLHPGVNVTICKRGDIIPAVVKVEGREVQK